MNRIIEQLIAFAPDLAACTSDLKAAFDLLRETYADGGKALVCGNGGSAADSEHIVGELMKGYMLSRPVPENDRQAMMNAYPDDGTYLADHLQRALPAISLASQVSLLTAFANDVAPDMIFAQQVYGYGRPGDLVWGLSTSGTSRNVLYALQVGRAMGLRTLGFTGGEGGRMVDLCDVTLRVPRTAVPEIQSGHQALYHALCELVEAAFFGRPQDG